MPRQPSRAVPVPSVNDAMETDSNASTAPSINQKTRGASVTPDNAPLQSAGTRRGRPARVGSTIGPGARERTDLQPSATEFHVEGPGLFPEQPSLQGNRKRKVSETDSNVTAEELAQSQSTTQAESARGRGRTRGGATTGAVAKKFATRFPLEMPRNKPGLVFVK
ncbi:hypothetical protein M427DRAFT_323841 [Gonapodya prolifera JEL478]|uniref:Uncharacterized protein n=1 Tax=Gonapodya prolifera (strain JEL478) TaxID=1344416 RepID=A0A139AFK3_GONPJ|nr:hypothetical protein M427DRAFT_323841 [Gonapodya prolifera JEL478]|eukprot:KXS15344.1 hypothetical protein M427DRAFT_323841 [Gonapodya prolifera JEL478]